MGIGQPSLRLSSLALAAHYENESVKHGLVSPAVLLIGCKLRDLGEVLGVDVDRIMNRAKRFRPLWRAISQRVDEIHAEERKRRRKAEARPNQYACAAEGCGIRGEQRAALRACAGRCPADLKPSYCSKECQNKVTSPSPNLSSWLVQRSHVEVFVIGPGTSRSANRARRERLLR